jgi:hypothetical protein
MSSNAYKQTMFYRPVGQSMNQNILQRTRDNQNNQTSMLSYSPNNRLFNKENSENNSETNKENSSNIGEKKRFKVSYLAYNSQSTASNQTSKTFLLRLFLIHCAIFS